MTSTVAFTCTGFSVVVLADLVSLLMSFRIPGMTQILWTTDDTLYWLSQLLYIFSFDDFFFNFQEN